MAGWPPGACLAAGGTYVLICIHMSTHIHTFLDVWANTRWSSRKVNQQCSSVTCVPQACGWHDGVASGTAVCTFNGASGSLLCNPHVLCVHKRCW